MTRTAASSGSSVASSTHAARHWWNALITVFLLNALYVAVAFSMNLIPPERIAERVREAFRAGALTDEEYLPFNSSRGWHQYLDCRILQLLVNPDHSAAGRALGPFVYSAAVDVWDPCRSLRRIAVDGEPTERFSGSRHARYWHGYLAPIALLLQIADLQTLRKVLKTSAYAALFILLLVGIARPAVLHLLAPVALTGILAWGLPYFGQGLSHNFGDTTAILGLACITFLHRQRRSRKLSLAAFAAFGSVVMYFDMMMGALPVAAGLLFPLVYLLSGEDDHSEGRESRRMLMAAEALAAFALGALVTLAVKAVLTIVMLGGNAAALFGEHLSIYTGATPAVGLLPGFLRPIERILERGTVLTYGSNAGLVALYASCAVAWLVAGYLAWRRRDPSAWWALAAFVIGACAVPAWSLLLQTHTLMHGQFITRILIVPISLGWAALAHQLRLTRQRPIADRQPVQVGVQ